MVANVRENLTCPTRHTPGWPLVVGQRAPGCPPVIERRAPERPPVIEQRAPGRLRWSSSERQRAGVETTPSRLQVVGGGKTQRRGGVRRGVAVCSRVSAWAVVEEALTAVVEQRAPASECRDHNNEGSRNSLKNLSTLPGTEPRSGPGIVGGRCQNSLYDNGIRRHRAAPGHDHDRRHLPTAARRRRPRAVDPAPGRDRDQPDRPGPAAAPDHRARAPPRPPRRPPRPRRATRRRRHRAAWWANTDPADQAGRQTPPRARATPWTATTSRSGTRWPPATSPRTRPW